MQDVISGETVTYTYDSLNRLIQASGTGDPSGAWSQQFTYDGFGNLTYKNGSNAPTNAFLATNPATNRLNTGGAGYDNNGNLTSYGTGSFAAGYGYDIENRMTVSAGPAHRRRPSSATICRTREFIREPITLPLALTRTSRFTSMARMARSSQSTAYRFQATT